MKLKGVCAALHGEALRPTLTTSVVQADTRARKDEITLQKTGAITFDAGDSNSVVRAFEGLKAALVAVLNGQRESAGNNPVPTLPFMFGSSDRFDARPIATALERSLPSWHLPHGLSVRPEDMSNPNMIPNANMLHRLVFAAEREIGNKRVGLNPIIGNFSLDPTYGSWRTAEVSPEEQAWEARFRNLKTGGEATRVELVQLVQERVRRELSPHMERMRHADIRFIRFKPSSPHKNPHSDHVNFFHEDAGLREAAAQVCIQGFGLRSNLCVKCPKDPGSPPFVDIIATHLADAWDIANHGEIRPSAVMTRKI